ncbi:hypothetical protein BDB00DRAFT_792640 [Zychaea mexicana]|uniref:uncharacterized protein n=1 Tax=Zychaea mexicana TaxID=64656 RepID=UPI0022FEC596|nr:uncharacterized protein BDB00DRAFT_792640 [Zychaea mexicana]KAI9484730.1 hypothetical protein BDB00DRAFT_792640 [Zychaea mexicana]
MYDDLIPYAPTSGFVVTHSNNVDMIEEHWNTWFDMHLTVPPEGSAEPRFDIVPEREEPIVPVGPDDDDPSNEGGGPFGFHRRDFDVDEFDEDETNKGHWKTHMLGAYPCKAAAEAMKPHCTYSLIVYNTVIAYYKRAPLVTFLGNLFPVFFSEFTPDLVDVDSIYCSGDPTKTDELEACKLPGWTQYIFLYRIAKIVLQVYMNRRMDDGEPRLRVLYLNGLKYKVDKVALGLSYILFDFSLPNSVQSHNDGRWKGICRGSVSGGSVVLLWNDLPNFFIGDLWVSFYLLGLYVAIS